MIPYPLTKLAWHLQLSPLEFLEWKQAQKQLTLNFDEASKGNHEAEGVGRVLYDPRGNMNFTYASNNGKSSNNQAKAYALIWELKLEKKQNILDLKVVGNSKLIIKND